MSKADDLYYQYRRKLNQENGTRQGYRREKSSGQGTRNERYINEVLGGQGQPVQPSQASTSAPKTRQQILQEYRNGIQKSSAPSTTPSPVYSPDGAFFPKKNPYEGTTTKRPNPFEKVPYSDPLARAFNEKTGWRDPGMQALYELAERVQAQNNRKNFASSDPIGRMGAGNIDLYNRPQYRQPDGSLSTVNSISIGTDEGEVLIPTIGRDAKGNPVQWTDDEAIENYFRTGQYLGKFKTPEEADRYAEMLHNQQEAYYSTPEQWKITPASVFRSGPIAGSDIGPRSRSLEAANRAAKAEKEAAEQSAAGIQFDRSEAVKRRQSNIIPPETIESITDQYDMRPSYMRQQGDLPAAQDDRTRKALEQIYNSPIRVNQDNPVVEGFVRGTGIPSIINAGVNAVAAATGDQDMRNRINREYASYLQQSQQLAENNPIAYGAGNIAGNIALMSGIGKVIGAGAGAINTASTAGRAALRMGASALNFAATTAIQEAGAAAGGFTTPDNYARDVLVSGGAGMASAVASMAVAGGLEKVLSKSGLGGQYVFLDYLKNLSSATAGAGARVGVDYAAVDKDPTDAFRQAFISNHPGSTEEDVQKAYINSLRQRAGEQFVTAFVFNLISSYMDTLRSTERAHYDLQREYDELEQVMEAYGKNPPRNAAEAAQWANDVHTEAGRVRSRLNNGYYAGQQDKIDKILPLLDEIDERANQWASNYSGISGPAPAPEPTPEFVQEIGAAMQQGAENPPAVITPEEPTQAPEAQEMQPQSRTESAAKRLTPEESDAARARWEEAKANLERDIPDRPRTDGEVAYRQLTSEEADAARGELQRLQEEAAAYTAEREATAARLLENAKTLDSQPTTTDLLNEIANTPMPPSEESSNVNADVDNINADVKVPTTETTVPTTEEVAPVEEKAPQEIVQQEEKPAEKPAERTTTDMLQEIANTEYEAPATEEAPAVELHRAEEIQQAPAVEAQREPEPPAPVSEAPAPLNETPAESKIESGKTFKVKDGDVQVAARRIFREGKQRGGVPTASLIGEDGRQYFTDGTMAVVLNNKVDGIGVQGETGTWKNEDAARYIKIMDQTIEDSRGQKDTLSVDYPSFHTAIKSLSKAKMTEYEGMKLFSFDGKQYFDFGPSAQMVNASKMETALRMIENPTIYYSSQLTKPRTPIYIKGDNGEAVVFGVNYPKAKQFLYGDGQRQETQKPASKAPEAPKPAVTKKEFATEEASKLSADLFQRKRVDQNGLRYTIRGDDGEFFGSIERIGAGNVKNARDTIYNVGPKATLQEVTDDLAEVAEKNGFLTASDEKAPETKQPEQKAPLKEENNGKLGDAGTGNGSSQGRVVPVGRRSETNGSEGTGEARPVTGGSVGENGRSEQGESKPGTGRDTGAAESVTEEKTADKLPPEAKEKIEEGVPETAATTADERPAELQAEIESKRAADIQPKGTNFVIPPEGLKLPNGEKARYKANVAAIQTLRTLMEDNRQATPEEQAVLSQYVGWGGLKSVFDEKNDKWKKEYKQLQELLSKEEYETAKGSVLNAHYTDVGVIRAIYSGLKGMGFKGGRIMEPAAGVGHFAGAMPSDVNVRSLTMVELDNITGNIAKYLYPNADVRVQGFEKAELPDNYMDLAISNVPFGNYSIFDKAYPKSVTSAIHNYFFAKSLDKVRPGGLVCFITSRYTMDAKDSSVRDYIMQRADLVGAIRLPDTAFKGNAGTDVVTDIIVLKKREAGTPYSGEAFKNSNAYHTKLQIWDQTNEYFQNHPEMVLGEASASGTMYRSNSITYKAKPGNLSKQIEKAFSNITAKMDYPARQPDTDTFRENRNAIRKAGGNSKNGSYVKENGKIYKNENGNLVEADLDTKKAKIVSASIDLRDTARQLLNLQLNNGDEAEINRLRGKLNAVYDSFVKEYGPLNKTSNRSIISGDSDSPFIFALENYNAETKTATKSDMFTKNTVSPRKIVEHVDNMEDGLAASLNDSGTVDVSLIARVTGKSEEDTTRELIDQKLAFKTKDGGLQSAQQYLAGNVRAKLKEARALAMIDKDFKNNVEELERVVPKDIEPADISVKPGATWIPPDLYADFAAEMLGTKNNGWRKDIIVTYVPQAGVYKVEYGSSNAWALKRNSYSISEYGTDKKTFVEIFEAALNNKDLKIYFPHGKDEKAVIDQKSTIAVKEKKRIIIQKFQEWMWSDKDRVKTYAPLYNDIFNNSAIPNYDGSKLQIEGLSSKISLREHQASAVQRIIMSGGNTLLAHGTGSGKTLEMAAAAMKLRQIGAVKKPMFVVPKNILGQWGNEFYSYFPNAKILLPGENDFTPARRKAFINKVTTGDWDAVIVSYEQFYKIPMSRDAQKAFYQNQIYEILAAQQAARETEGKKGFTVSALEKKRKQLQTKLEYLDSGARDDDNINFESLGVDSLFVDEAHNFKNLYYNTQLQNVSDLGNQTGSERAFDLYSKVKYLQSVNGGRGIVFATATPVMNSVVEMYTMQRYLQGDLLEQKGINNFDAWVNEFGDVQEIQKIKSDGGGYETRTSLAKYRNLAELQQMFRSFADVVTNPPGLADKLPKLRGGAPIVVECEPTDAQRAYLKELGKRSEAVRHSRDLKEDNILKIYSDGKKMSYTQRMIDSSLPYEEGGKILESVSRILKEYKSSSKTKGVQLVFCDTGVIGSNAKNPVSLWTDIKDLLVQGGIPENEIDFARSGMTDKQKESMMKKANDGTTRVLIGSTKTMGTGLNVQKRLIGMHEINCPDRPGDVDQNRGRLIRQGNTNKEVFIYTYITKETFDSRQWDNQKRKSAFIHQAIAGDINGRTADGDGEFSMSAAEISAIASGNPLIVEQNEVSTKIRELEALGSDFLRQVTEARRKLSDIPRQITQLQYNINAYRADADRAPDLSGDKFKLTLNGKTYTNRLKAGEALIDELKKFYSLTDDLETKSVGKVGDFELLITNRGDGAIRLNSSYECSFGFDSTPEGVVRTVVNATKRPEKKLKWALEEVDSLQKELAHYKEIAEKKFEHADELNRLRNREEEIMEALNPSNEQESNYADDSDSDSEIKKLNVSAPETESAHKAKWEAKRVGDTDKAPMSTDDIIRKIRHDLGLSITTGHIRGKGVMGQYNTHDQGIRTKIANDLPSLAHEVGHHFDQKYDVITDDLSREVKKELDAALRKDPEFNASKYKKSDLPHEGFAEYIRQYMQNREEAAIAYPKLTEHLKSKLSARELAQINNIADEINAYYSLDADNAQSSIRLREEGGRDFRTVREKIRDMGDDLYQTWVDSNHSIKRFDDATGGNAYKLASNAAYSDAVAGQLIVGDLTDVNGKYVGPGLKEALHGIDLTDRPTYIAFNEYLVCRHGQTWIEDGKRVFADDRKNSTAFMKRRVTELEAQYGNFQEAADRLVDFVQRFTQTWGVNTGLISQDTLDKWNEKYPNYVPMYRMTEKGTPGAKKGFANQNSPYKRAKGSGLDIMAPVDGIIDQIVRVTNTALRNNVMLEMRKAYQKSPDANANFISPVPTPLRPKTFDMTGMKAQLAGDISDAMLSGNIKMSADSAKELGSIIDSINDVMLQFERGRAKDNVVTILVNGNKEYWQVNDKKLLESIGNMNPAKISGVLELYAKTTRFLTANITGNNPIWSIFSNAPRDLGTFLVYSKSNKDKLSQISNIGIGWINSANTTLRDGKNVDPLYSEYLAMGGGWTSAYSADSDLAKKARKQLTSNKAARTMDTMNPLNWVSFMTDTIEQGPRFATYKLMRESGLSPQEAFFEAMDVTVNFRKAGSMSRQVNKVVPFFNAGLQGADKFARFFSAEDVVGPNRGKVAAGRFGAWAAASVILATLTYALNGRDKEKRKDYSQLSNYTKNNFWCIPLEYGQYFAIPKPRELAALASFAESVMDFTIGKNAHAFDEYYDYATDVFLPGIVSDLAQLPVHAMRDGLNPAFTEFSNRAIGSLGIIGAFHDLSANRDFLGRSIVSPSLEDYEPKDQFTRSTSKAAYWIGRGLNFSPQQIDYFGNQVLGYWWKIQKALFPVGEEYVDRSLGVKNTYFKDNAYSQDLVNWIYDQASKSARKYKSSQDPKDGIRAKNDDNMKKFYGNFYRISKDEPDTPGFVRPRQLVLDMINDYRSFTDNEILTPVQEAVYGVVERTNNMDLLPAVMKTEIKNGDASVELAPITYVQYQTNYNELYWKYIEDNLDVKASDKQQASVISAAKNIAREKAAKRAALYMGVVHYDAEDSKAEQWVDDGGDLSVWTDFENARKEGKQDGAADWLNKSSLSDEEKWALWELAGWSEKTFDKKVN